MFDFKSIQDFDKHINLSIPSYKNLSNVFSGITCAFAQPESSVVDIGCSTGRFLSSLPKTKNCKYIGIDESVLQNSFNNFEFIQADIEKALPDIKNISVIVSMFTLQFLGKLKRERVLAKIKEIINNGAVFLVAEKVYLDDPVIQTLVHKMHIQEKRKSFTDKDILNKITKENENYSSDNDFDIDFDDI